MLSVLISSENKYDDNDDDDDGGGGGGACEQPCNRSEVHARTKVVAGD